MFRAGAAALIPTPQMEDYVCGDVEQNAMPYSWSAIHSASVTGDIPTGSEEVIDSQDYGIGEVVKCMMGDRGKAVEYHRDDSVKIPSRKALSPPRKKLITYDPTIARETARRWEAEWLRDAEVKDLKIRQLMEVNRGLHAAKHLYQSMYETVLRETQLLRRYLEQWALEKVDAATSP